MIIELHLHRPAEFFPGWHPGMGGTRAQYAYKAKDGFEITREGQVYVVSKVIADVRWATEVPLANVRNAVLAHEPAQAQKGGRR